LERQGRVLGYLYVTSARKNVFEERHREIFDLIRGILSLAFENALAYEELSRLKDQAEQQGEYLRAEIQANWPADGLIGRSRLWKDVLSQISQVAQTDSTVLIQGETGTGKEVIARVIHERSRRTRKPLIKINCGALPENLVESELFGHERGSFTGAMGRRIGRFELANGGTIFLDEIGEMTMPLQVKLLRVLQEREFERVGGEKPIRVDVRVLTATNRDLSTEVAAGRFRADLFYRINVFPINIPPLRMRPEDASHLAQYFVQRIGERLGRRGMTLSPASLQAAQAYSWPGNVRELEHLIERGIILARGNLVDLQGLLMPGAGSAAFPGTMAAAPLPPAPEPVAPGAGSLKDNIADAERSAILTALEASGGVLGGESGAAARLGMKRQTLQSKMKKLRIVAKGTADGPGEAI
ncbi:sigma 54-interacting transcriptional regulator, partial [Candidatus Poribacteria bacterium]|nr:sigma 54-interacting transcriptional regulator [Candidatus Poribacteria bacterium]